MFANSLACSWQGLGGKTRRPTLIGMNAATPDKSTWIINVDRNSFQQEVFERSNQLPVVVDFWAPWCQPCRMLAPILEKLAIEFDGQFLLAKANTEELPEVAAQLGVQSIPAVYAVRDGQVRDLFVGLLSEQQIRDWLQRQLPTAAELLTDEGRKLVVADPHAAEAKYREAISLDEKLAAPRIGLAELLLDADRLDECREMVEQLEKRGFLEPEAEKIKAALGLRQQGDQVGDVESRRQAAVENPDNLQLQLKLAKALAASEQFEEALEVGLKIVQVDRRGLGEDARKLMVDVFRLLPDDSELTGTYRRKLSTALY